MRDMALRAQKDRLLTPLAVRFAGAIHPNWVSVMALGVGLASAGAVVAGAPGWGLALWVGNRVLDGFDGLVARVHDKQSDFGGYLDLLLDFMVYLAVPLAFMVASPTTLNLWAGVVLLSSYVLNTISWTVLAAILEKRKRPSAGRLTTVEMPTGLIEGAETILLYSLFFIVPAFVGWLMLLMGVLVLFTAGQRVVWAYRTLD
jgi:phosphatidylglycerophosphate synthase